MCVCVCVCVCVCMWCAHVLRMSFGLQRGTIHIMEEEVLEEEEVFQSSACVMKSWKSKIDSPVDLMIGIFIRLNHQRVPHQAHSMGLHVCMVCAVFHARSGVKSVHACDHAIWSSFSLVLISANASIETCNS